ncbi:NiFe hydrogenase [Shewanella dokdonensis]|uniref:NiFe hydrogenase n=1 Tax=Shewanella dokdonensis TaxID=712036 RepID=A0ABX8DE55_9GAMM|nr:NiFe hydrogenase [Shewanella dokdonensis]MCL1073131.1 NiFe hydrogenase [Shewanella dokdonensis]QVK22991.1 NiFe hydrogenase [Shewanella dokdonensis]
MKLLRFEFDCAKQVPWYGYLCNQYLNYQKLNLTIGLLAIRHQADAHLEQQKKPVVTWRYLLEAEGEQAELEQLAEQVAADFLLSVNLLDSRMLLASARIGDKKPLDLASAQLPFCQHCQPQFGDNQHSEFANLTLACEHCHGEQAIKSAVKVAGLQRQDIQQLAMRLLEGETLFLDDVGGKLILSRKPIGQGRQQLLVCNPNTLNNLFQVSNNEVLALSSIEKPRLLLRPTTDAKLPSPLYEVSFAASRLQLVLAEFLRVKGVDAIFCHQEHQQALYTHALGMDIAVRAPAVVLDQSHLGQSLPEPLHDSARFGQYVAKVNGKRQQQQLVVRCSDDESVWDSTDANNAAQCALLGIAAENGDSNNLGLLYFSDDYISQLLTSDDKGNVSCFMQLPELPQHGRDIVAAMEASPQQGVFAKFAEQYPEQYQRLQQLDLGDCPKQSLKTLWVVAAIIIGIEADSNEQLADAFVAAAMSNTSANAPRIDYPLVSGDYASINWCKTFGTLISFRLAGDDDAAKLAFAMNDSLADFIANWIERLDLNTAIHRVYLAGSSFANPVLGRRIALRLGKNFALGVSQLQDLDGALLATGALYLRQRRR